MKLTIKSGLLLALLCLLFSCISSSDKNENLLFEDYFSGDSVSFAKPAHWQWWIFAPDLWINEREDVPGGYGPEVMTLGSKGGNKTLHFGNEVPELQNLTDFQVTILWTDRLVVGEMGDGDFHIGLRMQPVDDREIEYPNVGYELEIDGDGADATNLIPADGPTHFHVFDRDGSGIPLASAGEDLFPGPKRNQWYWTKFKVSGYRLQAKIWEEGTEEPDWMIDTVDKDKKYSSGGIRLGVWSGYVDVAYVAVEKVENEMSNSENTVQGEEETSKEVTPWTPEILSQNILPDYSYAGYKNSEEQIPEASVMESIGPVDGDNTNHIQKAINALYGQQIPSGETHKVLQLEPGIYRIEGELQIKESHIVLRGHGNGDDPSQDTILKAVGNTPVDRTVLTARNGSQ